MAPQERLLYFEKTASVSSETLVVSITLGTCLKCKFLNFLRNSDSVNKQKKVAHRIFILSNTTGN